jgi:hypothetical protein
MSYQPFVAQPGPNKSLSSQLIHLQTECSELLIQRETILQQISKIDASIQSLLQYSLAIPTEHIQTPPRNFALSSTHLTASPRSTSLRNRV